MDDIDIKIRIDELETIINDNKNKLITLHEQLREYVLSLNPEDDSTIADTSIATEIRNINKDIIEKEKECKGLLSESKPSNPKTVQKMITRFKKLYPSFFDLIKEHLDIYKQEIIDELIQKSEEYSAANKELKKQWAADNLNQYPLVYRILIIDGDRDKITTDLNLEFDLILCDLIYRVEDKAGEITNFRLHFNQKGGFDGWIKGSKSKLRLDTVPAGGYNIQRFHYRTLLNVLEEYN